jgi:hypothetical protein
MNCLDEPCAAESGLGVTGPVVLAADAGVPWEPAPAVDPIASWLSLMEVVQALCPEWPAREQPTRGSIWRL